MNNKKGSISITLIIVIVVILGATAASIGYFAIKNISPSANEIENDSNVKIGKDGIKVNVGDDLSVDMSNDVNNVSKVSTVLIFDASGSMSQQITGGPRIDVAKNAVADYVESLDDDVSISVVAYGHKGDNTQSGKRESCAGVEEIYYMGSANDSIITTKVNKLNPNGWTPITAALQKAEKILSKTDSKTKHILLLSDGKETCDADPVAYAKELKAKGITIDVIGLGVDNKTKIQLNNISISGGGEYLSVNSENDLSVVIDNMGTKINTGNISIDLNDTNSKINVGDDIKIKNGKIKIEDAGTEVKINSSIPSF